MTAEIGILNREAVALAADSAVTSGEKIFPSANKIFTLSKYWPAGAMVYGSAHFMSTPWETVVKLYRAQLDERSFPTLHDYAKDFLDYLCKEKRLSPQTAQHSYVQQCIDQEFARIRSSLDEAVKALMQAETEIDDAFLKKVAAALIKKRFDYWSSLEYPSHLSTAFPGAIRSKYAPDVAKAKAQYFPKLLNPASSRRLTEIAVHAVTKISGDNALPVSGLVIAGYGDDDIYPALYEYSVEAVLEGELIYRDGRAARIEPGVLHAMVMPFAQHEMVSLFMEGIDPYYRQQVEDFVNKVLAGYPEAITDYLKGALGEGPAAALKAQLSGISSALAKQYDTHLRRLREAVYVDPIVSVVAMLPKGELASAAEALVNLTSFKRRVSRQAETVGGPIDVAVISKGDGFVWIKRKHYFTPDLNHHFFANYFPRPREQHGSEQ